MNYLQKYHLKKVEPVKGRPRNIYADYLKMHQRVEKVGVVKQPVKHRIPAHRNYFQKEEERSPPAAHKTEKHIRIDNTPPPEQLPLHPHPRPPSPKSKNMHRAHKSLNFKSGKDSSTGAKILTSIQGFFNKMLRNNEGCNCGEPCPWGAKFFRWVDVPLDIIKNHYSMLLDRWETSIRPLEGQSNEESRSSHDSSRSSEESRKNLKQILKDIDRTQSESSTFQNAVFKKRQVNILMCYAAQDPKIGYIQGMNIILSGILYHVKDEVKSFAIFRNVILNTRSIYINEFKECYAHIARIKTHLCNEVHDLHELFEEINVDLNIICLPWVLSLLTCLVPLDYLHLLYDGFIQEKWGFIYKACLAIFVYHKAALMQLDDAGDVISMLSPTNENKNEHDWEDILGFAVGLAL